MNLQMLIVGISCGEDLGAVWTGVGGQVGQVLGLHVVLECGEAAAGLDDAALCALILTRPELDNPLPDQAAYNFPLV